jgi:hypothetical protein
VPQAINPAIGFSLYNLRPFNPAVATPAVSIGLIYLIIVAFFSFSFYMPIHMELMRNHLSFTQVIIWRWMSTMGAYFIMSLCYSLVPLMFHVPFFHGAAPPTGVAANPNAYSHVTFLVYWMLNFVGMIALGLACENVAMIIGMPWTAMWLIFWVITNVSTSFYTLDLAPPFYRWGYAWPLHNSKHPSPHLPSAAMSPVVYPLYVSESPFHPTIHTIITNITNNPLLLHLSRRSIPPTPLQPTLPDLAQLLRPVRLGRRQYGPLPLLLLLHAAEGTGPAAAYQ